MSNTKERLIRSALMLLVCVSLFIGSTFAWFTDNVSSSNNVIVSGNLDVDMYWTDKLVGDDTEWYSVDSENGSVFSSDNWEPGYTEVKYLKVVNKGNLAFKYELSLLSLGEIGLLADVVDVYTTQLENGATVSPYDNRAKITGMMNYGVLKNAVSTSKTVSEGILLPKKANDNNYNCGETIIAIALQMKTDAGNKYQNQSIGDGFTIQALATQFDYEKDSFGNDYDKEAFFPKTYLPINITKGINGLVKNGVLTEEIVINAPYGISVTIPAGVKVNNDLSLTLSITEKQNSNANVKLEKNDELKAFDVHVEGIAKDNTVPMIINMGKVLPEGLNKGNLSLYHVEDNTTKVMQEVNTYADLVKHNQFTYEPSTGELTVSMATFSEVTVLADTTKAWEGNYDYSWYKSTRTTNTDYIIANADQLAAFSAIVGGMNGQTQDSFKDKTIKLISDVNLGDKENANEALIFHPIGYYYKDGNSTVKSFEGTFDGNGHTISSFYQNTWEIKGDYDGTYYKDAMGLFGYVYGGTVKNVTVDSFSSDGEYTPTGVIAAYADGNATFENIAITNCNPRVYNTGNGGIIGIAGDTSATNDDHITLKNITVDNTNIISALWGSWDVACGGLVGMYRGNVNGSGNATGDTISFENCHVSAQIDVYNDVCSNYQYYAYRYAGMIIGSVRHNTTNADGKTIPNMTGISASGCTVNYGDWNDYYYCEFEKNSLASYSEDYQFSRVPHSELKFDDKNGNGVVDADERTSVTGCKHDHTAKENHQAIYLPFYQLFTGYSWGVSSIGLKEYSGIVTNLDITEGEQEGSVEKFEIKYNHPYLYCGDEKDTYTLGELFKAKDGMEINNSGVVATIEKIKENDTVSGTYIADANDWTNGKIKFAGTGKVKIIIQDYNFCIPTVLEVEIGNDKTAATIEKFRTKFTNESFLYRVGNQNEVSLGSLFEATEGVTINNSDVVVNVEKVNEKSKVSGTFTSNTTDWTKGTIQFSGTGVVKVTIQENDFCQPTELDLEVVDAKNTTSAASATEKNIVLLNDAGFSSLEVSSGYTLYGNGFTLTCGSDSVAADLGYSFVTLNGGTLDNVQIVTPNFDYAVLYKSNMTDSGNRSLTTDKTRYYNVRSGVMVSGNSQILNSRISGGRAAVNVSSGNVVIDNSRIELGAVANILVGAANSLTLRDVTLVQKPTASTYDNDKRLMGFSVLSICDGNGKSTPITLEGTLVQNAWASEEEKKYVPSAGQSIISKVLEKTEYLHDIDCDGTNESLNLGFAYIPEDSNSKIEEPAITDNRTNYETIPYDCTDVTVLIGKGYVYSYKNTNGTDEGYKNEAIYTPNKYGDNIAVSYSDTADGLEESKSFGENGWVYELNVDLDKLNKYALDFSKLSMSVNGSTVTNFKVNGNAKPTSPVVVTAGGTTYTLTATIDGKEYTATYKVTGTETSKESPSLVASNYEAGLCVASSYGGTWHGAAPALQGIQIKYWSVAEKQYKTINLSNYTPTTKGQFNGTNTTWTYTPDNGDFTLTLTGGQVHSSNNVYAMPVVCDNKLYFVAASSKGLVNTGNSARTIPVSYTFKDNNNGDVLTFSHTWSVAENKDAEYSYSDFCKGTLTKLEASSGGGNCVTPDTLITLADGTQKRVDSLTGNEELVVWNLETGKYDKAPIVFVDTEEENEYEIVHLYFNDGSDVKVIDEHGFFDIYLGQYVYIDANNYNDYIGHKFVSQKDIENNTWNEITLDKVIIEKEVTTAWSPVTYSHLCYYTNGVLSMPGGIDGLFNIYKVNTNTMKYNSLLRFFDRIRYGVFTYADFEGLIPEEAFNAFNGEDLKVAMGKGLITWEDIERLAERYVPLMK